MAVVSLVSRRGRVQIGDLPEFLRDLHGFCRRGGRSALLQKDSKLIALRLRPRGDAFCMLYFAIGFMAFVRGQFISGSISR